MEQLILVGHLFVALAIIGLIMLQQGKGADIGASFGAGASQTLFGSTGTTNVLTKSTAWLSAAFFASSFSLAMIADSRTAGDEDLGFEIPVEASSSAPEALPIDQAGFEAPVLESSSEIPQIDGSESGAAGTDSEIPSG
ncbi:secretion protein SecG [Luminiphilus syltensis NOR5-1B]|uniref:Protein-export membrane protein SecG n=1 Tax=Luminiphilus syltensis NOR5-1B TaxID=565045 RepID=B8KS03_9GAMM|nr:preprotein translocase subunit SecG [Luminiphilus syltensis]EED34413.1 secretion protein SecG [Luminiphilus syltensis NOR5-1B]